MAVITGCQQSCRADRGILIGMAVAQVRDVAAKSGVSPATVSNVLNHPEKVSRRTRERVLTAIEELGYVPNDAARQLRAGTNRAAGMVVLDAANPFFTDIAHGAEMELAEHGRPLLIGNSSQREDRESVYLDLFEEQRVAGILISPVGNILPRLRRLKERGTAVVLVDRKTDSPEFSSVSLDDRQGGRLVASHLIEQGATHIAVIGGPAHLRQVKHRLQGARQRTQQSEGVHLEYVESPAMDTPSGKTATAELLDRPANERPDALFATNDLVALGALQELARAGIHVPSEIMLAGYDDIAFAASATVPITSIHQPAVGMGSMAAELLCEAMDSADSSVRHTVFQPELVIRESTARR